MLGVIIVSSVGLAMCLCWLGYQAVLVAKSKNKPTKPVKKQKYEYVDEYEEGDNLVVNLKNY